MRGRFARGSVLAVALAAAILAPGATPAAPGCANDSALPGGAHPGGDWRIYGHDDANTRTQPAEKTIGPLEAAMLGPVWTFSSVEAGGSGDVTGTPVVADGCVFVGSNDGWVFAMNADSGEPVWKAEVPAGGGVNSSITVPGDGRVYAAVSHASRSPCTGTQCEGPYVIALDQDDGSLVWQSTWHRPGGDVKVIDVQPGSDVYGSPVVFDGLVFEGVSGGSAELGDEADRYAFQGSYVILDAATGDVLKKEWVIHPPNEPADEFAGAGIWSTPALDRAAKLAYVGTANPFRPQAQHEHANAILKIDLDRASPTFGQILDSFAGTLEEYVPALSELPCVDTPGNPPPYYPQGLGSCSDADLDFGSSPHIFDVAGTKMVGAGQKSGVFHAFDAETMGEKANWSSIVGPPTSVGGIVGSTAYDGEAFYGPITPGGYLWSIRKEDGLPRWISPVADAVHWGNPVAVANGIVYTVDLKGFLDAYDATTGAPLLHRPIAIGSGTGGDPVLSWGGVSVARNTVYAAVGITGLPNGFVVAFRPGGGGGGGGGPEPPELPGVGGGATIVAGPGTYLTTYWTPIVVVQAGNEKLSFTSLDLPAHNVVHRPASGPELFRSALAGLGESVPVAFSGHLERGKMYEFFCEPHPGMFGTVLAV